MAAAARKRPLFAERTRAAQLRRKEASRRSASLALSGMQPRKPRAGRCLLCGPKADLAKSGRQPGPFVLANFIWALLSLWSAGRKRNVSRRKKEAVQSEAGRWGAGTCAVLAKTPVPPSGSPGIYILRPGAMPRPRGETDGGGAPPQPTSFRDSSVCVCVSACV